MSLIGALNVGSSALTAQQAAVQVTGNNISNAGDADYTRQVASLTPGGEQQVRQGVFVGQGVNLENIKRQIDDGLQGRLNAATSDSSAADASQQYLGQVESAINALGDNNISTQLDTFFGSWSSLANNPQDTGLRQVVVQDGRNVAQAFSGLRGQLTGIRTATDQQLAGDVKEADGLAGQIATLNGRIAVAQGGSAGSANSLLDQRDAAIKRLSQLADVTSVAQADGTTNVYIGSEPLVMGTNSRGLTLTQQSDGKTVTPTVTFKSDHGAAPVKSGEIGGLLGAHDQIGGLVTQFDGQANALIFELNKLHASGQGVNGFTTVTSTNAVSDPAAALNDPAAGLPDAPTNGSFVVHVKDAASGLSTSTLIKVSLTGNKATDTTLDSLQAQLAAIPGVSATVADGKLTISAGAGQQISFSQDSSGALAAMGVNNFYTGSDAADIAVNPTLQADPSLLAAAKNGDSGDNQTARAIAALQTQPVGSLNGSSLDDAWQSLVTGVGNKVAGAKSDSEAAKAVVQTLQGQRQALSGVSLDEEAVNLIKQQTAYQAAARLITTVNEMMTVLMNMAA